MSEHELTDIFLFLLAAIIGGLVGGALSFVLSRISASDRKPNLFLIGRKPAKILRFPKR